jgi:hypothetical protein
MMTDYLSLRISAVSARCKFGAMIQDWYRCNGWQRWTLASWAESAGFYAIPYGRMPDIFGGTAGELSRQDFEALGEANRRLAARDYGTFANYRDAQAISNAVPLLHESGAPWTASDFWACYCGLLAPTRPMTRHD